MSTINPYNELGQILATGGEIALAIGFSHGRSDMDTIAYIRTRFPPLPRDDEDFLVRLSKSMSEMDDVIKSFDPSMQLPVTSFPRNPLLFGDDWGGKRIAIGFDASIEGSDQTVQIRTSFPDVPTFEDLLRAAEEELERRIRKSPGEFAGMDEEKLDEIILHILYAERRF